MALFSGHSSAGVYVKEIDRSLRSTNISTSTGAIVGASKKGPVGRRTLVTNDQDFVARFGEPDPTLSFMHYAAVEFLRTADQLYVTRVARNPLYGGVAVSIVNNLNVAQPISSGLSSPEDFVWGPDNILLIAGRDPGVWNGEIEVSLYPKDDTNMFIVEVYHNNVQVEYFEVCLDYKLNGFGVQVKADEYINRKSNYIQLNINESYPTYEANPSFPLINTYIAPENLQHGHDGDPITTGDVIDGWELYRSPEEVDVAILINGGYTNKAVQHHMVDIAEDRMDAIAILDMPAEVQGSAQEMSIYRKTEININSSYAALYGPNIYVSDNYNGMTLYIPPSGHVAAAYAAVDYTYGCWWAPAGMENGRINCLGVTDLYDLGERDLLEDSQINLIRLIRGHGIRLFGASTLTSYPSALQNINVRRMMSYIEKNISTTALFGVYRLNDIFLRSQLAAMADDILSQVKAKRGIYNYTVICDESNNTPDVIAGGDTILDVYVDPTIPAKRIHINAIVVKTGGVKMSVGYAF